MTDWGPKLWIFLHSLAEKTGKSNLSKLQEADEVRYILQILKKMCLCMPCIICRKHYNEWLIAHPLRNYENMRDSLFRENIKNWLYKLHSDVNKRKGVLIEPAFEDLEGLYGAISVRNALRDVPIKSVEMKEVRLIMIRLISLAAIYN